MYDHVENSNLVGRRQQLSLLCGLLGCGGPFLLLLPAAVPAWPVALIMEERYFVLSTPDDGVPTTTSAEQENAEEACRDSLYDYADDSGKIDRES